MINVEPRFTPIFGEVGCRVFYSSRILDSCLGPITLALGPAHEQAPRGYPWRAGAEDEQVRSKM